MHSVTYQEFQLQSMDGTRLFVREWRTDDEPKAWIAMSHGQSEHSGRYEHVGRTLAERGYALVIPDLHGHGKSDGKRGHIKDFSQYTDDLQAVIEYIRTKKPISLILGGHSLGGLIAATTAIEDSKGFDGLFLSGAALRLGFKPPAWKMLLAMILSITIPGIQMSNELNLKDLTQDEDIVEKQRNDPLNHGFVTPRFLVKFLKAQEAALKRANCLKLPLLVMHGECDQIISVSGSEDFYEAVSSKNKKMIVYKGFFHEIFNELDRIQVLLDLINWLEIVKASE